MIRIIALTIACLTLTACVPVSANRGNLLDDYRMKEIVAGQDMRDDVVSKVGSPTNISPFDDSTWYYLGQKTEKRGIFDPEIVEEKIVVVKFGTDGFVDSVVERREGREDVPLVARVTPTTGNDYTFLQQMLGNLGKFNQQEGNAANTAGSGTVGGGVR